MNLGFRAEEGAVDDVQFSTESEQTSTKNRPIHRVRKFDDDIPQSNKMKPIITIGGIVYMQRSDGAAVRREKKRNLNFLGIFSAQAHLTSRQP